MSKMRTQTDSSDQPKLSNVDDTSNRTAMSAATIKSDPLASIESGSGKLLAESDDSIHRWARERIAAERAERAATEAEGRPEILDGWKPMRGEIL